MDATARSGGPAKAASVDRDAGGRADRGRNIVSFQSEWWGAGTHRCYRPRRECFHATRGIAGPGLDHDLVIAL